MVRLASRRSSTRHSFITDCTDIAAADFDVSLLPCPWDDDDYYHKPPGSDSLEIHLVDSYYNFGKDNFEVAARTETE